MKNPTSKKKFKLSKSTKYYLICGGAVLILIVILLLIYALLAHINILAWFGTKWACLFLYGPALIYGTVGLILFIKDKIARM